MGPRACHCICGRTFIKRGDFSFPTLSGQRYGRCMKCMVCRIAVVIFCASTWAGATPSEAKRALRNYQSAMDKWALDLRGASTPDERAKAWAGRPDATPFARQVWTAISQSLREDWTLEAAAWFLKTTPRLLATDESGSLKPIFNRETDSIRTAVESHHLKSPALLPVCVALAANPNPRSLTILEKIQQLHPDPKIQGVAALGAAMQLKALGDDADLMKKRITYIKKAVINSAEVDLDGVTVGELAKDELYIISHLSKGRVAPDLAGLDVAGKAISLAANKGKVIALIFWNSGVPDAKRVVEITSAMEKKFKGRPFIVIGVNNDPVEKLRALQADGTVPWNNLSDPDNKLAKEFRVGIWPLVYILDGERKIHYAGAPGSFAELTAEALLTDPKTMGN